MSFRRWVELVMWNSRNVKVNLFSNRLLIPTIRSTSMARLSSLKSDFSSQWKTAMKNLCCMHLCPYMALRMRISLRILFVHYGHVLTTEIPISRLSRIISVVSMQPLPKLVPGEEEVGDL